MTCLIPEGRNFRRKKPEKDFISRGDCFGFVEKGIYEYAGTVLCVTRGGCKKNHPSLLSRVKKSSSALVLFYLKRKGAPAGYCV